MGDKDAYRPTFVDRFGPEGLQRVAALTWGAAVFTIALMVLVSQLGRPGFWMVAVCALAALVVAGVVIALPRGAGWLWTRFLVDGSSTPSVEQYSFEQSLVMQRRVDEALASFETIMAEQPSAVTPRLRAAELYDREKKDFARAAELFREVQRIESASTGEFVFATNRLVDLYAGPLNAPGRALVELRRLIDRCPGTPAASHAREALARLKTESRESHARPDHRLG